MFTKFTSNQIIDNVPSVGVLVGAVHKVRHARGLEGVPESVTVCDRGRGSRACDVTLINFLSYI